MHQGCTGDGNAERGKDDNLQSLRVLENCDRQENMLDTQPHGGRCGAPTPEAMESQAGAGGRPPRKEARSSVLAPGLQIVGLCSRGVPWLRAGRGGDPTSCLPRDMLCGFGHVASAGSLCDYSSWVRILSQDTGQSQS